MDSNQEILSIEHLTELAKVPFDPSIAIKSYLRTCELLYERAKAHENEDDHLNLAFIYLIRASSTLLQDLPSHPDYDSIPTQSKLRIQSLGSKYLRALAPIKAKLAARSQKPSQTQPLSDHRKDHSSVQNASIVNSTLSPPLRSNSISFLPQSPTSPSFSSSQTLSRSISSGRTPSSKSLSKSSQSFPSSSKPHNSQSDVSHKAPAKLATSHQPGSPDSLNDWTLLPSSAAIPYLETWHTLGKKKSSRRPQEPNSRSSTSPTSPSTLLQSGRSPLVWPIALGNGQGQPMSTALPLDQAMKAKPSSHAPRRSASHRTTTSSNSPQLSRTPSGALPSSVHPTGPSNFFHRDLTRASYIRNRFSNQAHSNTNQYDVSAAPSRRDPSELYNLRDQAATSPMKRLTQLQGSPRSPDFDSQHPPAHLRFVSSKPPLSSFRRASSSDNIPSLTELPNSPEVVPSNSTSLSGIKSLIRPRRTSWTYHQSKSKSKSSPSTSLSANVPDKSPSQLLPCYPSNPSRPRRASIGESSTWRWLKGLNIRSSDKPTPKFFDSPVSNLYTDNSPAQDHKDIKPSTLLYRASTHHSKTKSSSSKSPQTCFSGSSPPFISSPTQNNRQPLPPRDFTENLPRVMASSLQPSFEYRSPNHSDSNSRRPHTPLRSMRCPKDLIGAFLAMAEPQTEKGIELCGLLLGKVDPRDRDILVVDTLLIPEQISTPDTCHTINEGKLFKFQNEMGLMTLGWIHTHPTQTCFLSSLDLHTHLSYQLMMPESVAIVCSPKKEPSLGVFKLIDPDGIQLILNCKESGSFHPHSLDSKLIYCDADDHFKFIEDPSELVNMKLDIRDLRN